MSNNNKHDQKRTQQTKNTLILVVLILVIASVYIYQNLNKTDNNRKSKKADNPNRSEPNSISEIIQKSKEFSFKETISFALDLTKIRLKHPSIVTDVETIKKVIKLNPCQRTGFSRLVETLKNKEIIEFYRIACKSKKGTGNNSGIRLVYEWNKNKNEVTFTNLYYISS